LDCKRLPSCAREAPLAILTVHAELGRAAAAGDVLELLSDLGLDRLIEIVPDTLPVELGRRAAAAHVVGLG